MLSKEKLEDKAYLAKVVFQDQSHCWLLMKRYVKRKTMQKKKINQKINNNNNNNIKWQCDCKQFLKESWAKHMAIKYFIQALNNKNNILYQMKRNLLDEPNFLKTNQNVANLNH